MEPLTNLEKIEACIEEAKKNRQEGQPPGSEPQAITNLLIDADGRRYGRTEAAICPLLSIAKRGEGLEFCVREACFWYDHLLDGCKGTRL